MSMETELKKIAINLQQLTDAVTTLTAVMELHKPVVIPETDANVASTATQMGESKIQGATADTVITDEIDEQSNVVDITKNDGVTEDQAAVESNDALMTMQEANVELQAIVAEIGDGGKSVRDLLTQHNAISLAQIPVNQYREFVEEARKLIPAKQA